MSLPPFVLRAPTLTDCSGAGTVAGVRSPNCSRLDRGPCALLDLASARAVPMQTRQREGVLVVTARARST
ncbi:MAG TPA: hypothetical protein VFQ61_21270 [Polyangiaceae bacterium]|nr:hypothetical protein [Polyangiaceae bacterium]